MKRNYRKSKEQLDKQNKERIIAEKKHQYRQVLMRIFKRQNNTDISQLNILGITETGLSEGEILFKCKRDSKQETYVIRIQTIEGKKMYKITKPAEEYIEASKDCWLFIEDVED